jgi:hypothetical protein
MIAIYLDTHTIDESFKFIISGANTLEILADVFIVTVLHKRFAQIWKKSSRWIKHQLGCSIDTRLHPSFQLTTIRQANTLNQIHE